MDLLLSLCSRHASRLQDDMMLMSPDDYKALEQYVCPRDVDAVVSAAADIFFMSFSCLFIIMLS